MDFDPVSGIVGLDWPVLREGGVRLDHAQKAVSAYVPSTATETITEVRTWLTDVSGSPTIRCDVVDLTASAIDTSELSTEFAPNEDVAFSTTAGTFVGVATDSAGNRYTNVDESSPGDTDYISKAGVGTGTWEFRIGSGGGLAGAQIISQIEFRLRLSSSGVSSGVKLYYRASSVDYELGSVFFGGATAATTYTITSTVNPATGAAWTEAELAALDSTTSLKVTMNEGITTPTINLYWVRVVTGSRTDVAAASSASVTVTADGLANFTFGSSLAKVNAHNLAFTFRRDSSTGTATIPELDSGDTHPAGLGTYRPTLDSSGSVTDFGDLLTPVIPMMMVVAGPAYTTTDSNPYIGIESATVDVDAVVEQKITRPSTATVGWVQVVAGSVGHTVPDAPLLVKIKNGAGTQQGGTATFGPEILADAPRVKRAIDTTMASTVSLTNGTQYRHEFSSTATAGHGWSLVVLRALDGPSSFGGSTDFATVDGSADAGTDVTTVQGTVPTAPA